MAADEQTRRNRIFPHMNNYFENPLYRQAFFADTDRITAGFRKDFALLKPGPHNHDLLKNIHRYAHSLKGLFAMMEFTESRQIAAGLESAAGQAANNASLELDEKMLVELKNGFDKIEGWLKRIKDDAKLPAAGARIAVEQNETRR